MKFINNVLAEKARELFAQGLVASFKNNPRRAEEHSLELEELLFDYSKNFIDVDLLQVSANRAVKLGLKEAINNMFEGHLINTTEGRAVLHVALRNQDLRPQALSSQLWQEIWATYEAYTEFAQKVSAGECKSASGETFTDVVSIGIGGSHLPVQMAYQALDAFRVNDIKVHFVANVDGVNLHQVLAKVNPKRTLFIVASKTFTTQETMLNATAAKKWLQARCGEGAVANQFAALSTNTQAVEEFGIKKERTFKFWDFVGGRFSLWSSIALPLVIAIGKENFAKMLGGAKVVDLHFREAPLTQNIPFIMALGGMLQRNAFHMSAEGVIPYSHYLGLFPNYLQQVVMESNGKTVTKSGEPTSYTTSMVLFGDVGTNAQHSFFQLLHQGSDKIGVDLIGFATTPHANATQQDVLVANMIAQAEALMIGKSITEVEAELQHLGLSAAEIEQLKHHKAFAGNRPTNTLFFTELTPKTLGMLCALYEHKVFCQGYLWDINSFDQYGVELGKVLANNVLANLTSPLGTAESAHDSSTTNLIQYYKQHRAS